ncbi:MAG TPA: hypothetical protein DCQ76_02150 [Ruminococcaceae bacterium]|nr:hypothetical protein [Oscillospiraceae bacterium]
MRITVNKNGQVVNITDSTLVANSTYGNAKFILAFDESLTSSEISNFATCAYSVIRADGVQIGNMYMALKGEQFEAEIEPGFGILDVSGSIQISFQVKTKGDGKTKDDGKVFATIAVAAFVQNNIGKYTQEEANDVETKLEAKIETIYANINAKVDKIDSDGVADKAYIKGETGNTESPDYVYIERKGEKKSRAILGATQDGDYIIPNAEKPANPVNLGQLLEQLKLYIQTIEKGSAGGVAPLNENTLIDEKYIPSDIINAAGNVINKVDKIPQGPYDRVYIAQGLYDSSPDKFRSVNSKGKPYAYSLLGADAAGVYRVPEATDELSPVNLKQLLAKLESYILATEKGTAGGVAILDGSGKVPASQLPGFVDDVLDSYVRPGAALYSASWLSLEKNGAALTPEEGKLYIVKEGEYANHQYRWTGSQYGEIASSLALGEVTGTAYDGGKGKALRDELTAEAKRIDDNEADIAALRTDVDTGETYIGAAEPDNKRYKTWIDTTEELFFSKSILKSGDYIVLTEEQDADGTPIIKISVKPPYKRHNIKISFASKMRETDTVTFSTVLCASVISTRATFVGMTWNELCDELGLSESGQDDYIPAKGSQRSTGNSQYELAITGFNRNYLFNARYSSATNFTEISANSIYIMSGLKITDSVKEI